MTLRTLPQITESNGVLANWTLGATIWGRGRLILIKIVNLYTYLYSACMLCITNDCTREETSLYCQNEAEQRKDCSGSNMEGSSFVCCWLEAEKFKRSVKKTFSQYFFFKFTWLKQLEVISVFWIPYTWLYDWIKAV